MSEKPRTNGLVLPPHERPVEPADRPEQLGAPVIVPTVDTLLSNSLAVLGLEVTRLLDASRKTGLVPDQTLQLQRYIRVLRDVTSEERIQRSGDEFEQLADEELEEVANEALRALRARRLNATEQVEGETTTKPQKRRRRPPAANGE